MALQWQYETKKAPENMIPFLLSVLFITEFVSRNVHVHVSLDQLDLSFS